MTQHPYRLVRHKARFRERMCSEGPCDNKPTKRHTWHTLKGSSFSKVLDLKIENKLIIASATDGQSPSSVHQYLFLPSLRFFHTGFRYPGLKPDKTFV